MKAAAILTGVLFAASAAAFGQAGGDGGATSASAPSTEPTPASIPASPARWAIPASAPASAPAASDLLAAASLRASALDMVYSPSGTPARAARLVAFARFACKLQPDDPRTNWLLSNIYETQGHFGQAADAVSRYLGSYPQDYGAALRWLGLRLGALERAEDRLALLEAVGAQADVPAAVRAEAAAQAGQILLARGDKAKAREAYALALELDPYHPAALNAEITFRENPTAADRAASMFKLIRSNPAAVRVQWDLGTLLEPLGLHDQALAMFDCAWRITTTRTGAETVSTAFLVQYLDAMLDAGRAEQAIKVFRPMVDRYPDNADLRTLLIEAFRSVGDAKGAEEQVKALEAAYRGKEVASPASAAPATELAWFHLITLSHVDRALVYAEQAARQNPDDPIAQRVLGAAELASGQAKEGENRLVPLMDKDIYAAVFLAEHYYAVGDEAAGRKALLAGAAITRSGPGFRRLDVLAKQHEVALPPAAGSEEVLKVIRSADVRYLDMGLAPQKYVEVTLRAAAAKVAPCEPLRVEATLKNIGPIDVPLGQWGLLSPAMSLQAEAAGGATGRFANVPLVSWPAPHYLKPGESVTTTVPLDVGEMDEFLLRHPLDSITIRVSGVLDPLQRGDQFISSLPGVQVAPATMERTSLLGDAEATREAYSAAIKRIVSDLKSDSEERQGLAASQAASLYALVRAVERQKAKLPDSLQDVVTRPLPVAMVRTAMRSRFDVVRAEVLASLQKTPLDEGELTVVGGLADDPSALVRLRVAELLGVSATLGKGTVEDYLARDKNEFVRWMAEAFRTKSK
jgi:tetratricopeptide (TPR) repeat protein